MDRRALAPAVRADLGVQRAKLAAIETNTARARQAGQESFVSGYRSTLW
jgi:hypothetical protein